MFGMEQLIADLKALVARHAASPNRDFGALIGQLNAVVAKAETEPAQYQYQYRHHMAWDATWQDIDESQLPHVLKNGHTVQRRRVYGGWEQVIEVPT
jgi:hypothetical protein